jgi:RNA polymerase sigma factor (sigma-70 family)
MGDVTGEDPRRLTDEESELVAANYPVALHVAAERYRSYGGDYEVHLDGAINGLMHAARRFCREPIEAPFGKLASPYLEWSMTESYRRSSDDRPDKPLLNLDDFEPIDPRAEQPGGRIEAAEEVEKALGSLPSRYAETMRLVMLGGMTYAEAAGVLGCSKQWVHRMVARSAEMLSGDREPSATRSRIRRSRTDGLCPRTGRD